MSLGTLSGVTTALSLVAFLGVAFWAYGARRRATFERAARVPLEEVPVDEVLIEDVLIQSRQERSP